MSAPAPAPGRSLRAAEAAARPRGRWLRRLRGALGVLIAGVATPQVDGAESQEAPAPAGPEITVMSFNVAWSPAADPGRGGRNSWSSRRDAVVAVIRAHDPDLVGLQEAGPWQVADLLAALPRMASFRRDPVPAVPNLSGLHILYRASRFSVDESASASRVARSDLPPRDWGPGSVRVPMWARFVVRGSGRGLYLFNVHHDHRFEESRKWSAALLARTIRDRAHRDPVVVTGDFNAGEHSPTMLYLLGRAPLDDVEAPASRLIDSFRKVRPGAMNVGTYHAFGGLRRLLPRKIDFVLVGEGIEVLDAAIVRDKVGGRYPSDHYPVTARLRLGSAG